MGSIYKKRSALQRIRQQQLDAAALTLDSDSQQQLFHSSFNFSSNTQIKKPPTTKERKKAARRLHLQIDEAVARHLKGVKLEASRQTLAPDQTLASEEAFSAEQTPDLGQLLTPGPRPAPRFDLQTFIQDVDVAATYYFEEFMEHAITPQSSMMTDRRNIEQQSLDTPLDVFGSQLDSAAAPTTSDAQLPAVFHTMQHCDGPTLRLGESARKLAQNLIQQPLPTSFPPAFSQEFLQQQQEPPPPPFNYKGYWWYPSTTKPTHAPPKTILDETMAKAHRDAPALSLDDLLSHSLASSSRKGSASAHKEGLFPFGDQDAVKEEYSWWDQ